MNKFNLIRKYIYKYKYWIISNIIFALTISFLDVLLPKKIADIINMGINYKNSLYIINSTIPLIFIILLSTLCKILLVITFNIISNNIVADIRKKIFNKIGSIQAENLHNFTVSTLINRTVLDGQIILLFIQILLNIALVYSLTFLVNIYLLLRINLYLSYIILLSIPLLCLACYLNAKITIPLTLKQQILLDKVNNTIKETISGIKYIKVFNNKKYHEQCFNIANESYMRNFIKLNIIFSLAIPTFSIFLGIVSCIVITQGAYLILDNFFDIGSLVMFLSYMFNVLYSLVMLSILFVTYPKAIVSFNRINEILQLPNKKSLNRRINLEKIDTICFKNVSFNYGNKMLLKNLNFSITSGNNYVIKGPNSSGKSTIAKLILGLYDNYKGEILINNISLRQIDLYSLRSKISYVPQSNGIFNSSIRYNIDPKNLYTDSQIYSVLKKTQFFDFVNNKKEKLYYLIEEDGKNLSGGQKKRLLMTRALIKNNDLQIFDDSFSFLDSKTSCLIKNIIFENKNKINIFINEDIKNAKYIHIK